MMTNGCAMWNDDLWAWFLAVLVFVYIQGVCTAGAGSSLPRSYAIVCVGWKAKGRANIFLVESVALIRGTIR